MDRLCALSFQNDSLGVMRKQLGITIHIAILTNRGSLIGLARPVWLGSTSFDANLKVPMSAANPRGQPCSITTEL